MRFDTLAKIVAASIEGHPVLHSLVHSVKYRAKDPNHLRDKLRRKAMEANQARRTFNITPENILTEITDLAGVRLLHLHTDQIQRIDDALKDLFQDQQYILHEGPEARTWDDEYRALFRGYGIAAIESASLYTSVHYVVLQNTRNRFACEVQVRTLMEEVWGEVSHTINYPHPTDDFACMEQIKVLARATSSCTRLVDSIFRSHAHAQSKKHAISADRPKRKAPAKRKART